MTVECVDAGVDGGTDAGVTDAGSIDAGAIDTGVDGGNGGRRELNVGCGCASTDDSAWLLVLLAALAGWRSLRLSRADTLR